VKYRYIFGPVPSRRLGLSLGIDIIPYKTCTLNCIYCECGRTTKLTLRRKEWVPTKQILKEIKLYLSKKPEIDFVTFSGSGEPTLHKDLGKMIDFIKKNFPHYKVAVLTNGTLLYRKSVRKALLNADVVVPSLDAATKKAFKKINRPHKGLDLKRIIKGIADFKKEYKGKVFLEIFVVPDINTDTEQLKALKKAVEEIKPDKIQINTLARPPAESWVKKPTNMEIKRVRKFLKKAHTIPSSTKKAKKKQEINIPHQIYALVFRRPVTIEDIGNAFHLSRRQTQKYIRQLLKNKKIFKRGNFFVVEKNSG